jgi:hypothetical protein
MSASQTIIVNALCDIGAYGPGETPSPDDLSLGLTKLNNLLDSWAAEKLQPLGLKVAQYTLTGAASYTIGPSGTFNTTRPMKIKSAAVVVASVVRPVDILTAEKWDAIADKTRSGTFADTGFYDNGFPLATISLNPKPASGQLKLTTYEAVVSFPDLTTVVNFPPGYERALTACLGVEMAPAMSRPLDQTLLGIAAEAKGTIAKLNAEILGIPQAQTQPQPPAAQQAAQ